MNDELTATLQAIADLLGRENELLRHTDYGGAADLLPEKQALFARLTSLSEDPAPASLPIAQRLLHLARDNQTLLARAIHVQGRIIGIVMQAIQAAGSLGYTRDGKRNPSARVNGLAISTKI